MHGAISGVATHFEKPTELREGGVMLGLICMKRVIADEVTNMLMIQIIKNTHYQQVTAIHFTDPWDRGMGCQRGMVE